MKNNNGKIAIAIVAMFVVALSVVGFTYAYFTAQVQGNKNAATSVEVTAGTMVIKYDMGDKIETDQIVPGWKNDGKMFYDPKYSVKVENGISKITAVSTDDFGEGEGKLAAAPSVDSTKYGLKDPVTFTVTNTGTRDSYYKVSLESMVNNLNVAINDDDNLTYTVYVAENIAVDENGKPVDGEGNERTLTDADYSAQLTNVIFDEDKSAKDVLFGSDETPVTLSPGKANFYKIIFHYHETDTNQTDSSKLEVAFAATVKVVGLGEKVTNTENTVAKTTTQAPEQGE